MLEFRKAFARKKKQVLKAESIKNNTSTSTSTLARTDFKAALHEIEEKVSIGAQLHELVQKQVKKLTGEMVALGMEVESLPSAAQNQRSAGSDAESLGDMWEKKQQRKRTCHDRYLYTAR